MLVLLFISISSCGKFHKAHPESPNILLILSEGHSLSAISAYDSIFIRTPNIDRIAKEGVLFTNAFSTASANSENLAALLTGKYSHLTNFENHSTPINNTPNTWVEALNKYGYYTSFIGKWHLASPPKGFDSWSIMLETDEYFNPNFDEMGDTIKHYGYITEIITKKAIRKLEERQPGKPFAMLIHHKAPGRNWMPSIKKLGTFDSIEFPVPRTFYDNFRLREASKSATLKVTNLHPAFDLKLNPQCYKHETDSLKNKRDWDLEKKYDELKMNLESEQLKVWGEYYSGISEEYDEIKSDENKRNLWIFQRYLNDYLSTVLSIDESVGELLKYLDKRGLMNNTIVVYTSANGSFLGEHGWYGSGVMYKESHRKPLLIRFPKMVKGNKKVGEFVVDIDLAHTMLDFTSIKYLNEMQGQSLRPLLTKDKNSDWRTSVYYHHHEKSNSLDGIANHYGILKGGYKLIHFYDSIGQWQLFNLKTEPNEVINEANNPEYIDIKEQLIEVLDSLRIEYRDTIP